MPRVKLEKNQTRIGLELDCFLLLLQRDPALKINELIEDLKSGVVLLTLLEVLSGCKLQGERGRILKRPHFLSNCNTALEFLRTRKVRFENFPIIWFTYSYSSCFEIWTVILKTIPSCSVVIILWKRLRTFDKSGWRKILYFQKWWKSDNYFYFWQLKKEPHLGSYFNYVSMFLPIFDQVSTL